MRSAQIRSSAALLPLIDTLPRFGNDRGTTNGDLPTGLLKSESLMFPRLRQAVGPVACVRYPRLMGRPMRPRTVGGIPILSVASSRACGLFMRVPRTGGERVEAAPSFSALAGRRSYHARGFCSYLRR